MKKFISLMLALILAISVLSACGGESTTSSSTNNSGGSTTDTPENEEITIPESEKEAVIVDDDYVTATFEKIYDATSLGVEGVFYIDINVKNKTSKELWIYLDGASVNGEMVPMVMSGIPLYVKPEKSGHNAFIISFTALSFDKVEDVKNIEFDLVVADKETLSDIERIKGISLDF